MSKRNNGSTADAQAEIERTAELRAAEAEMAGRAAKAAQDLADAKNALDAAAANLPKVAAATVTTAVVVKLWSPAESLSAEAIRLRIADFGRTVLAVITDDGEDSREVDTLGTLRSIVYSYETGELSGLLTALGTGSGIKALPRHSEKCAKVRAFLASMDETPVCPSDCPMVNVRTAPAARAAGTATATAATGSATGHSLGNVSYNGATGSADSVSCKAAATLAAVDFPDAAIITKALASTGEVNFRKILKRAIIAGQVPAGTFGSTIVAEITPEEEAAVEAAAPATVAAVAAVPTAPTAENLQGASAEQIAA